MLPFDYPAAEVIQGRFSCRAYQKSGPSRGQTDRLEMFANAVESGPFNTRLRFQLALALEHDPRSLRGLGTYGLIKDPAGFIIGAAGPGKNNLEDFGYGMEFILLCAAGLGINTCWLGGNFTKSSFSSRIGTGRDEIVPAVASLGIAADQIRSRDRLRQSVKSDTRLPWEKLFFRSDFRTPLTPGDAGEYALALEMARLAPSGHNYQPWRVVRDEAGFHFYLQRTPGYGPGSPLFVLMGMADLQRVEMGICLCHFELAAGQAGLIGAWIIHEPGLQKAEARLEYTATWRAG